MNNPTSIFGWKNVLYNYGFIGIILDSILPIIISLILIIVMYISHSDVFVQLKHLLEVGFSVVPTMVALILAAYTILLTFISGEKFKAIKDKKVREKLIKDLNSNFAACLFISSMTIISMILISCIANIHISINNPDRINYPIFFLISYLLIYSVNILIGIIIDIFNCGQTILLDDDTTS